MLKFRKFLIPDGNPPGGGGAAVVDPPAGDQPIDPLTFVPPTPQAIEDFLSAPEGAKPPEGTVDPTKTDPAKKPAEDAAAKAAAEKAASDKAVADKAASDKAAAEAAEKAKLAKEPPAAQLREQLKKLETSNADLLKQLEAAKSDKRIEELSKKLAANDEAMKAKEAEILKRDKQLAVHNPHVAKPLNDMKEAFNTKYANYTDQVPKLAGEFRPMLDEFEGLPRGTPEYAAALEEFRTNLKAAWGDDAPVVYEALREGLKFRQDYGREFKRIQESGLEEVFKGEKAAWEKAHTEFDKLYVQYFEPPADYETTDPLHPVGFLRKFEETMPADEVARINANLKRTLDQAFNGAQPRTKADFVGLDDAQIAQELSAQEAKVKESRALAMRMAAVGGKLCAFIRPILAEYAKMRDRIEAIGKGAPPDPTKTPGSDAPGGGGSGDDLMSYTPPPVSDSVINA